MTPCRDVITRLLLGVAMVMCLLGLAGGGASADAHVPTSVSAHHAPSGPTDGHSGHGAAGGTHVTDCMAATGALALSVLVVPATAGSAALQAAPDSRLRSAMRADRYPRPPDRATLCVQRI